MTNLIINMDSFIVQMLAAPFWKGFGTGYLDKKREFIEITIAGDIKLNASSVFFATVLMYVYNTI